MADNPQNQRPEQPPSPESPKSRSGPNEPTPERPDERRSATDAVKDQFKEAQAGLHAGVDKVKSIAAAGLGKARETAAVGVDKVKEAGDKVKQNAGAAGDKAVRLAVSAGIVASLAGHGQIESALVQRVGENATPTEHVAGGHAVKESQPRDTATAAAPKVGTPAPTEVAAAGTDPNEKARVEAKDAMREKFEETVELIEHGAAEHVAARQRKEGEE